MLLLLVMVCVSCAKRGLSEEELKLLEAVRRYNNQLQLAYLEVNLNYLAPVATKDHLSTLFPVFQALRAEDDYMRAEQETFEIERVRLTNEGTGEVDTTEKWAFWWQDHQTNEITKPPTEVAYHMRYNLVLESGTWKVYKLEDLEPDE